MPANSEAEAERISVRPMRVFPLACVVFLGAVCALIAFLLTRVDESERVEREFAWRAHSHLQALRTNLERSEECLYTLRDLFLSSDHVTLAEFQRTAQDLRRRHRGVQQLQWIPRVKGTERAEFETMARQKVLPGYEIFEHDAQDISVKVRAAEYQE